MLLHTLLPPHHLLVQFDVAEQLAGGRGVAPAEAAAIEERYKQQISEIESSMKQTWEEKMKLSQQYDVERQRIVRGGPGQAACAPCHVGCARLRSGWWRGRWDGSFSAPAVPYFLGNNR